MATYKDSLSGSVITITLPDEEDKPHGSAHAERLAATLGAVASSICLQSAPLSCIFHDKLVCAILSFELRMLELMADLFPKIQRKELGLLSREEDKALFDRLADLLEEAGGEYARLRGEVLRRTKELEAGSGMMEAAEAWLACGLEGGPTH